jgi:DNA-binding response OmpR family regulator
MTAWKTTDNKIQIVLIVSRDAKTAAIWEILFKQKNYYVIHETAPRHALQSARLLSPALIIVDLDLPQSERLSLCKELRPTTDGALFLLAPQTNAANGDEYFRAGVTEHISPTISPTALLNKSLTWLTRNQYSAPRMQLTRVYA